MEEKLAIELCVKSKKSITIYKPLKKTTTNKKMHGLHMFNFDRKSIHAVSLL